MTRGNKQVVPFRRNAPRKCKPLRVETLESKMKKAKLTTTPKSAKTYFSTIPQDALENVVRFTSERPHSAMWKTYVEPSTALRIANSQCELSACALRLFNSVQGGTRPGRDGISVSGWGSKGVEQVEELMRALSEGLTELDINSNLKRGLDNRDFPPSFTKCLVSQCPNLKHLSLRSWNFTPRYTLDQILSARSGNLESLEVTADMRSFEINAIATHCKGLKRLLLHFEHLTASLDPVWQTVGPTLEDLSLGDRYIWLRTLPKFIGCAAIAQHCRSIRKLGFERFRSIQVHELIHKLVTGYGKQLEELTLEDMKMPVHFLVMISMACENVAITSDAGSTLLGLSAMGTRASHVSIWSPYMHQEGSEMYELVSKECTNMVSLDLAVIHDCMSGEDFKALFSHPKYLLRNFQGSYMGKDLCALSVLAQRVSSLRRLTLQKSFLSLSDLAELVAANQGLRKIELFSVQTPGICLCQASELDPAENFGNVLSICLESPSLREVDLNCLSLQYTGKVDEFVEACNPARHRGVSVRICGYQYL